MSREEVLTYSRRTIEDNIDVVIARMPGIPEIFRHASAHKAARSYPGASPEPFAADHATVDSIRAPAGVAAAVFSPAAYAVRTTPCGVLVYFDFVSWRVILEKLTVIGDLRQLARSMWCSAYASAISPCR